MLNNESTACHHCELPDTTVSSQTWRKDRLRRAARRGATRRMTLFLYQDLNLG